MFMTFWSPGISLSIQSVLGNYTLSIQNEWFGKIHNSNELSLMKIINKLGHSKKYCPRCDTAEQYGAILFA